MSDQPRRDTEGATDVTDVEGHGLPTIMGVNEMSRARSHTTQPTDEPLPQLKKPFPRLKDDQKKR